MVWQIDCGNPTCQRPSWAANIVDLISECCSIDGMLICQNCKNASGYIKKEFKLQEEGEVWEPILRGVIKLGKDDDTYQPFVYLASYGKDDDDGEPIPTLDLPLIDLWFSYYKDLRSHTREDGTLGRLKMGYGPGGPPVLGVPQLLELLRHMLRLKMISNAEIATLLAETSSTKANTPTSQ